MRKILLILFPVLLIGAGVSYFLLSQSQLSKNNNSIQRVLVNEGSPQKILTSDKYKFSNVAIPSIDTELKSVGLDTYNQTVGIFNSTDSAKIVAWSGTPDNRKSGFGFSVIGNNIQINIYVSPSLSQNDALLEVNKEYITALYYAVEFKKTTPKYQDSIPVAFNVFKQVAAANTLPIILK